MITPILFIILTILIWASSGGEINTLYTPIFNIQGRSTSFGMSGADVFMLLIPIVAISGVFLQTSVKNTFAMAGVTFVSLIILLTKGGLFSPTMIELFLCAAGVLIWKIKELGGSHATST